MFQRELKLTIDQHQLSIELRVFGRTIARLSAVLRKLP